MLYQFKIELSDIDRGIYEKLDFRAALHPSETLTYLLTRVLAFNLSFDAALEFSPMGLGDPDGPALWSKAVHGQIVKWIEVGNPSTRKLHKVAKQTKLLQVFTYKNADILQKEIQDNQVHRGSEIQIFALSAKFLSSLESSLEKSNRWSVLIQQNQINIGIGENSILGEFTLLA